jgi:hypothetical protein
MTTRLSTPNKVILSVIALGSIWAAARGNWAMGLVLAAVVVGALLVIRSARQGRFSDTTRLDIGEPLDERERVMFDRGLAWVGLTAIAIEMGTLLYRLGAGSRDFAGADWRLVALCIVWAIANRVQVRRGGTGA